MAHDLVAVDIEPSGLALEDRDEGVGAGANLEELLAFVRSPLLPQPGERLQLSGGEDRACRTAHVPRLVPAHMIAAMTRRGVLLTLVAMLPLAAAASGSATGAKTADVTSLFAEARATVRAQPDFA